MQGSAQGVAHHKKQTSKAILHSAGAGERRKVEGRKILSGFAIFHFLATKPEDASKVRERGRERGSESNDRYARAGIGTERAG